MFDTRIDIPDVTDWDNGWGREAGQLTDLVKDLEARISGLRACQIRVLRRLDRLQVDLGEGSRTMPEWVAANLDVSPQTSARMMRIANGAHSDIDGAMTSGEYGVDRADLLCRIRGLGGPEEVISDSSQFSLGYLYGLVDRLRTIEPTVEVDHHRDRYLVIQPSLDRNGYRFWGQTSGVDGRVLESAVEKRETQLPVLPDQSHGARRVDALVSICLDALTTTNSPGSGRAVTVAEIFVDAHLAASSFGEVGSNISTGPRVGPNTLSEILCGGKVRVITQGEDGRPIGVSDMSETIPPAVRSYVLHRDQARCGIEGCRSRYRLQPHHITPRAAGGDHDPDNLTTLCWYHHHVAIHMLGMTIDNLSPPHRRRLTSLFANAPPS